MLNLIKHEFIKSKLILTLSFSIFILIEICYIISGIAGIDTLFFISSIILFMLISVLFSSAIVYSTYIYDIDISQNHKYGYMLFMTPNNSYKIIGAKIISSLIIGLIASIIIILTFILNANIVEHFPLLGVDDIFSGIYQSFKVIITDISFWNAFLLILNVIIQSTTTITSIYLSKMLCNTLFYNIPIKGILAFGVFILINIILGIMLWLTSTIATINLSSELNLDEMSDINALITTTFGELGLVGSIIITLIFMITMYISTSYLCEKKLSI